MLRAEPIRGVTDQRYYHVAIISPKEGGIEKEWLWRALGKEAKVRVGRFGRGPCPSAKEFEFRTIHAPSIFAGSTASRDALASEEDPSECAYDVFIGSTKRLLVLGTGYASLTKLLVHRLVAQRLLTEAWFLVPELRQIVELGRQVEDPSQPMKITITGFNAFVPGVKNLQGLRLSGGNVFGSGLMEHIEDWLVRRGRQESEDDVAKHENLPERQANSLRFQAVRVRATGAMSGSELSFTLRNDGSAKLWLRKNAINLPELGSLISMLNDLEQFRRTAEPPKWAEEPAL